MTARHAAKRFGAENGSKVCSKCKETKPVAEFWARPGNHDGYRGESISCTKAMQAKWNSENAERKRIVQQVYFEEHRAEYAAKSAKYYIDNIDEQKRQHREWREHNIERAREISRLRRVEKGDLVRADRRRHYQKNKARYKAQAVARMKHIKQATPSWADMEKITAFYVEAERLTGETGIPHHVDHIYPLRGKTMCGLHVEGNLQIVHAIVNLKKSNRVEESPCTPPPGSALFLRGKLVYR